MTLAAPEHQEMNRQFEVTLIKFRTIKHSLMVPAIVSEVYIYFALMYTTDHIFTVLPIKYLINEYGDSTISFKLATGTKPSVLHLCVLFCTCVVWKATTHVDKRR